VNIHGCLTWSYNNCDFNMPVHPIFLAIVLTLFMSTVDWLAEYFKL